MTMTERSRAYSTLVTALSSRNMTAALLSMVAFTPVGLPRSDVGAYGVQCGGRGEGALLGGHKDL